MLLQHEGLAHQGGVALEAVEAGVVPVPVLEMQLLPTGEEGNCGSIQGLGEGGLIRFCSQH